MKMKLKYLTLLSLVSSGLISLNVLANTGDSTTSEENDVVIQKNYSEDGYKIYALPNGQIRTEVPERIFAYGGEHRIIAKIDDVYNHETYNGECYYCHVLGNSDGKVYVENSKFSGSGIEMIGSTLSLTQHSGGPGGSVGDDTLIRVVATYVVTGQPDYGYRHYKSQDVKPETFKANDVVYSEYDESLYQCKVENWCNGNPMYYEPGKGLNWDQAWSEYEVPFE